MTMLLAREYLLCLPYAMGPGQCLEVHVGVPVVIKDDDGVRPSQRNAQTP